jgi:hypothetical protein
MRKMTTPEIVTIDLRVKGVQYTLREYIMSLRSKQYPEYALFLGVDQVWRRPDKHVFTFTSAVEDEAMATVTGLLTRMKTFHGKGVEAFFTHYAIQDHEDATWDTEKGEEINDNDRYVDAIIADTANHLYLVIDENEEETTPKSKPDKDTVLVNYTPLTEEQEKIQRQYYGKEDDSIATYNTAASKSVLTSQLDDSIKECPASARTSSSISSDLTMNTRMTDVEWSVSKVATDMDEIKNLLSSFISSTKIKPGTGYGGSGAAT